MTLHYHGLPLTPEILLLDLSGRNVCISFATARQGQLDISLRCMQSIMFDNGAFSHFRQGTPFDPDAFYAWVEPHLGHPHWAVIPDKIDGSVEEQREYLAQWPFPKSLGAPVWHLGLPIDYLLELADEWPRICLGSSGNYWQIGSVAWRKRMDEAFDALDRTNKRPWVHGLRMMDKAKEYGWLASVDSVNVARNFKSRLQMPGVMAERIDAVNGTPWAARNAVRAEVLA